MGKGERDEERKAQRTRDTNNGVRVDGERLDDDTVDGI